MKGNDNMFMSESSPKKELRDIIERIPDTASYNDIMYELYVRMKIAKGEKAVAQGKVLSHDDIKQKIMR